MKVLIVDDSIFIRKFVEKYIKESFPDAYLFFGESGEQGYDVYKVERPDVIITDLLMPGMGGKAFLQLVRQSDNDVKIVVLSADIQKIVKDEVEQMNILEFFNKPLNTEKLQRMISILKEVSNA
jgi:two-component system, chemotaxis family, chemotaxis protein CheY